jgi:hypothetical protein
MFISPTLSGSDLGHDHRSEMPAGPTSSPFCGGRIPLPRYVGPRPPLCRLSTHWLNALCPTTERFGWVATPMKNMPPPPCAQWPEERPRSIRSPGPVPDRVPRCPRRKCAQLPVHGAKAGCETRAASSGSSIFLCGRRVGTLAASCPVFSDRSDGDWAVRILPARVSSGHRNPISLLGIFYITAVPDPAMTS